MQKISSQLLQTLTDSAAAHPALAAAAASGLIGGGLTMGTAQRRGETPGGRRMRILRNALLAAGAGGGAVALGRASMQNLNTALPAGDVDPVTRKFTSPMGRAGMGVAGIASAQGLLGGPHRARELAAAQAELGKNTGITGLNKGLINSTAGATTRDTIQTHLQGSPGGLSSMDPLLTKLHLGAADRELYAAGLPSPALLPGKGFGASLPPATLTKLDNLPGPIKDLLGVARGAGRGLARGAAGLLGPGARLSGRAGLRGSPLARTALGSLAVLSPEIFNSVVGATKDYVMKPQ